MTAQKTDNFALALAAKQGKIDAKQLTPGAKQIFVTFDEKDLIKYITKKSTAPGKKIPSLMQRTRGRSVVT